MTAMIAIINPLLMFLVEYQSKHYVMKITRDNVCNNLVYQEASIEGYLWSYRNILSSVPIQTTSNSFTYSSPNEEEDGNHIHHYSEIPWDIKSEGSPLV